MGKSPKIPQVVKKVQQYTIPQSESYRVSYSQLSTYLNCKRQWKLAYVDKVSTYVPSIHTVFGTALHETIQLWLHAMYNQSIKVANELDLHLVLYNNLKKVYSEQKQQSGLSFSSTEEMQDFYQDGIQILDYLKKKRAAYFTTRKVHLVGVEVELGLELKPGVKFKGFIDVVFYDEDLDRWLLLDIKTSTSGWNAATKKDDKKIAQLLLYKEYFAKQFDIPVDSIDIEFFIVKRKVPVDPEYVTMSKRVQQFRPASGKIKRGQAINSVVNFVTEALDAKGRPDISKEFQPALTSTACKFCDFKNTTYCPESKNIK